MMAVRRALTRGLSTKPTYLQVSAGRAAAGSLLSRASHSPARPPSAPQDGPPPGGYPSIKYKSSIPAKGPSNLGLLAGLGAFLCYGWYFTIDSIHMRNRLKIETYDTRMSLLPYLQAEEDQRYVEVRAVLDRKEAELMADVPGWEVNKPTFETIEWVRPKSLPY